MVERYNGCAFGYKRKPTNKTYPAGFVLKEMEGRFEIWDLRVVERYRNKGYATRMLTEFLSTFQCTKPLVLYVRKVNEIAIHLYEKVGFVITGECDFNKNAYTMLYEGGKANDQIY